MRLHHLGSRAAVNFRVDDRDHTVALQPASNVLVPQQLHRGQATIAFVHLARSPFCRGRHGLLITTATNSKHKRVRDIQDVADGTKRLGHRVIELARRNQCRRRLGHELLQHRQLGGLHHDPTLYSEVRNHQTVPCLIAGHVRDRHLDRSGVAFDVDGLHIEARPHCLSLALKLDQRRRLHTNPRVTQELVDCSATDEVPRDTKHPLGREVAGLDQAVSIHDHDGIVERLQDCLMH